MSKRLEIFFDNNHTLVLCGQEEGIANELGQGLANRQNNVIVFETHEGPYIVPLSRILYVHVVEEADDVRSEV